MERDFGDEDDAAVRCPNGSARMRVGEMLPGCSPSRHVRWTVRGDRYRDGVAQKNAYADDRGFICVGVLNGAGTAVDWTELTVDDLGQFGTYVDVPMVTR